MAHNSELSEIFETRNLYLIQVRFVVLKPAEQDRSETDQVEGNKNMFRTWLFLRATPRSDLLLGLSVINQV